MEIVAVLTAASFASVAIVMARDVRAVRICSPISSAAGLGRAAARRNGPASLLSVFEVLTFVVSPSQPDFSRCVLPNEIFFV
jgi:hypothetical protein